jgi:hypothetical protein
MRVVLRWSDEDGTERREAAAVRDMRGAAERKAREVDAAVWAWTAGSCAVPICVAPAPFTLRAITRTMREMARQLTAAMHRMVEAFRRTAEAEGALRRVCV